MGSCRNGVEREIRLTFPERFVDAPELQHELCVRVMCFCVIGIQLDRSRHGLLGTGEVPLRPQEPPKHQVGFSLVRVQRQRLRDRRAASALRFVPRQAAARVESVQIDIGEARVRQRVPGVAVDRRLEVRHGLLCVLGGGWVDRSAGPGLL